MEIARVSSLAEAQALDAADPLSHYRQQFHIPTGPDGTPVIYLCGNSLGLQPKAVRNVLEIELNDWALLGVEGHFAGRNPWFSYHERFALPLSRLLGAQPHEVVAMNSLSVNLQLMLTSFYKPQGKRFKIIVEGGAFPSDYYAVESQLHLHGYSMEQGLLEIVPRVGEVNLRQDDILSFLNIHANEVALVLLGGVNYYTGQSFNLRAITQVGHSIGAMVGFDLAHAVGNIPLQLHESEADFAVWCSYKYLNSGPGGVGGAFVHDRWAQSPSLPRLAGWWGHAAGSRFNMKKGFQPSYGAEGWQLSNAPVLSMAAHAASLAIFDEVGISRLREKSLLLTGLLEALISSTFGREAEAQIKIITTLNPDERGCQLSLVAAKHGRKVFDNLTSNGVIADWREPDVIRVAPVPLYNTFEDVFRFVELLQNAIHLTENTSSVM